jgi:hypothetical protein
MGERVQTHQQAREEQIPTGCCSIQSIMRSEAFLRGVQDVRVGRSPRFDSEADDPKWCYERGRQFGVLSPRNLSVVKPGTKTKLNPAAVKFFIKHFEDIL